MARDTAITNFVERLLEEGFRRKSWHGTNLRGSVRRLSAEQAAWRPTPGRKCIAEIVVHAAYWKYTVRRRLTGEKRGSFPLRGNNWFPLPTPFTEAAWQDCVKLLEREHTALLKAVELLKPEQLERAAIGGSTTYGALLRGIAFHDIYHTGQIQTLKALQRSGSDPR